MIWPLTPLGTALLLLGVAIGLALAGCQHQPRPQLQCVEISERPRWDLDCAGGYETYYHTVAVTTRYLCCPT